MITKERLDQLRKDQDEEGDPPYYWKSMFHDVLEAVDELLRENEELKEKVKVASTCIDMVTERRNKLERVAEAAGAFDKAFWYDANEEGGACHFCDANLHRSAMGKHQQLNGDPCAAQVVHEALQALRGKV